MVQKRPGSPLEASEQRVLLGQFGGIDAGAQEPDDDEGARMGGHGAHGADAALLEADHAFRAGQFSKALQLAFSAIDRRPNSAAAYELTGDILANAKSHDLAESLYQHSLTLLSSNTADPGSFATVKTPQQL